MAFRVGVAGCGGIAQVHGEILHELENVEIAAAADIKPERAESFCKKFGGRPYSSLDDMLAGEKLDVLHICTPHYLHVPMAVKALSKNINVLLEKPAATSPDELDTLKKAVCASGKALGVCYQNRYLPTSQKAFEMIKTGNAGPLLGARAFVTWSRNEKYYTESGWRGSLKTECGGVMINQAIHTLDLMLWLAGDPVRVEGSINNHHLKGIIEVEDTAELFMDFGNDAKGLFYASTAYCRDAAIMLEVCFEKMILTLCGDKLTILGPEGEEIFEDVSKTNIPGKKCWGSGHGLLISDYYSKLQSGEHFPIDINEAERSLRVLFELYKSSRQL